LHQRGAMEVIWQILIASFIGTIFIFTQILSCILFHNFSPLYILLPVALTPVPLLLLRCCGGGDDIFATPPKAMHWAEFFSAFFATGVIAIPVLLKATDTIELGAMLVSLGGFVFLLVCYIIYAVIRARSNAEGGSLTGNMYM